MQSSFVNHHWVPFQGQIPQGAVHASDSYVVIRANHGGQLIPGKLNVADRSAYIPYGDLEVKTTQGVEVLVLSPGAEAVWVPASHGQVPQGAVGPIGQDGTFVGRVICPQPENKHTPGKVHPANKCLYIPWGGKEQKYENYEVLVIRQPQFNPHQQSQTVPSTASFNWIPWQGAVPHNAVRASDAYVVARAHHGNDWVPGKLSVHDGKTYIPYGDKEVHVQDRIEILTHAPGAEVQWVPASHGQVAQHAVGPIGNEGVFVGRVLCPHPENKHTPGKIHPNNRCFYLPWDGKETKYENYEVLVIRPPQVVPTSTHQWVPLSGPIPSLAVRASDAYAVIRAQHGGDQVPGKLSLHDGKAYIPYAHKEVHVTNHVEVLVLSPGVEAVWVPASHGQIPQGTVGPIGKEGLFVGRALCPQPENKHTPGKIHPTNRCFYLPWGGKENSYENYEALVIRPAQHQGYPNIEGLVITQPHNQSTTVQAHTQPSFVQPGQPQHGHQTGGNIQQHLPSNQSTFSNEHVTVHVTPNTGHPSQQFQPQPGHPGQPQFQPQPGHPGQPQFQPHVVHPGQPQFGQPTFAPNFGGPSFGGPAQGGVFGQPTFTTNFGGQVHGQPNQATFGQPNVSVQPNFGGQNPGPGQNWNQPQFNPHFGPGHK